MLLHDPQFDAFFKRTVTAVAPYADSLVCIGGCANALYRHHPLAAKPWPTYLGTMDADWAVPQRLSVPVRGVRALPPGTGETACGIPGDRSRICGMFELDGEIQCVRAAPLRCRDVRRTCFGSARP
jgi:hypothetical protein